MSKCIHCNNKTDNSFTGKGIYYVCDRCYEFYNYESMKK